MDEGIISTAIDPSGNEGKHRPHSAGSPGTKYGMEKFKEINKIGRPARVVGF